MTFLLTLWRTIDWRAWLIIGVVVTMCVLFIGWRCEAERAREAATDARLSQGQARAGQTANEIAADQAGREADQRDIDQTNAEEIRRTDNADQDAGDAGRAGLRALCRRMPDNPRCRD